MSSSPDEIRSATPSLGEVLSSCEGNAIIELIGSAVCDRPHQEVRIRTSVDGNELVQLLSGKPSEEFYDTYYDIDSSFPLLQLGCWLFCRTHFPPHYKKEWRLKICTREAKTMLQWKEIRGEKDILSFFQQHKPFRDCKYLEMLFPFQVMQFGVCRYSLDDNSRIDVCGSDRPPMTAYAVHSSTVTSFEPFTRDLVPSKTQAMLSILNQVAFNTAFSMFDLKAVSARLFDGNHPLFSPCEKVLELKSSHEYRESFFWSSDSDCS